MLRVLGVVTRPSFQTGLVGALNPPTIIAVVITGLAIGYVVGLVLTAASTPVPPILAGALAALILLSLQCATVIGQSINMPANGPAYMGSHIAYALLSILLGALMVPGMVWARRERRDGHGS